MSLRVNWPELTQPFFVLSALSGINMRHVERRWPRVVLGIDPETVAAWVTIAAAGVHLARTLLGRPQFTATVQVIVPQTVCADTEGTGPESAEQAEAGP
jgi:hypothetical protein